MVTLRRPGIVRAKSAWNCCVRFCLSLLLGMALAANVSGQVWTNAVRHRIDLKPVVVQAQSFAESAELPKLSAERSSDTPAATQSSGIHPDTLSPPILNFDGISNVCTCLPPDTIGDVGPSNYVQGVNISFQVFNKFTGAAQTAVLPLNSLFTALGGACATNNDGYPNILYDPLADRWLIAEFVGSAPFYMSIAVSKTSDPTGGYYAYCFPMPDAELNDYPQLAVWPDGYYMTDRQFTTNLVSSFRGAGVFAFDRAKMLMGDPTASYIYFDPSPSDPNFSGLLPADVDGAPPPAGTPDYFAYFIATAFGATQNALRVFAFHADFSNPGSSTFTERPESPLAVAAFAPYTNNPTQGLVVPQPSTSQRLQVLGDRLMRRLQYRNFGSNETLVVNHTVKATSGVAGIRFYQLRRSLPGGNFGVYEQGTWAPADGTYRWMGSAAMDYLGNLAVGYNVSSSSVFPGIRYSGRLATDPTNFLDQGEIAMQAGAGVQTFSSGAWGAYSALAVDPTDDVTFWYTSEYMATTSAFNWRTRIGTFQMPGATAAPHGTIHGTVLESGSGLTISNAVVRTADGFFRVTGASGTYSMTVTPGTYDMSAAVSGRGTNTASGVTVTNGAVVMQNFLFPSTFQITSVARESNSIRITWSMSAGTTNALQRTAGGADGSYNTNGFATIFAVTNAVGTTTNYLDAGVATNFPARYYRVRLVP
jgi:hypothetical protein